MNIENALKMLTERYPHGEIQLEYDGNGFWSVKVCDDWTEDFDTPLKALRAAVSLAENIPTDVEGYPLVLTAEQRRAVVDHHLEDHRQAVAKEEKRQADAEFLPELILGTSMGPNPFYGLGTIDETKPKTATAAAREPLKRPSVPGGVQTAQAIYDRLISKVSPAEHNARALAEVEATEVPSREVWNSQVDEYLRGHGR